MQRFSLIKALNQSIQVRHKVIIGPVCIYVLCVCVCWCIVAGCIVKHMGVPLHLVAMVNSNDVVHRAVQSGDFSMADSVKQTLAPAIDIQVLHVGLLNGSSYVRNVCVIIICF